MSILLQYGRLFLPGPFVPTGILGLRSYLIPTIVSLEHHYNSVGLHVLCYVYVVCLVHRVELSFLFSK